MIGSSSVPSSFKGDRFTRSGATSGWPYAGPQFDPLIRSRFDRLQEQIGIAVPVHSCRSNRSEILTINRPNGSEIAWDETFFDYVLVQLEMTCTNSLHVLTPWLGSRLLGYVGETVAFEYPHHAIVLWHLAESAFPPEPPSAALPEQKPVLGDCFRIIRAFVLFHELGHIAISRSASAAPLYIEHPSGRHATGEVREALGLKSFRPANDPRLGRRSSTVKRRFHPWGTRRIPKAVRALDRG